MKENPSLSSMLVRTGGNFGLVVLENQIVFIDSVWKSD